MPEEKRKIGYQLVSYGLSDPGDRENNEDVFVADDKRGIYLLCDGMGGPQGGDFASFFTSQEMMEILSKAAAQKDPEESFTEPTIGDSSIEATLRNEESYLRFAIWQTNERLHRIGLSKRKSKLDPVMGTTIVGLWFIRDKVWSLNIGDSRAYGYWDGLVHRLTRDDCWVAEQILVGSIDQEDARRYRSKITKAVGPDPSVEPQIHSYPLPFSNARFLLSSDGFYDHVPIEPDMKDAMSLSNVKEAGERMINAAIRFGKEKQKQGKVKKRDNITVLLVDLKMYGVAPKISEGISGPYEAFGEPTLR